MLTELVSRILTDHQLPGDRSAAEPRWREDLWNDLSEAGIPTVSVPEAAGGSGGSIADALEILRLVGQFAAPVPVAEHGLLAGWLLAEAGIPVPDGVVTVVPEPAQLTLERAGERWMLTGTARFVPFASVSDHIAAICDTPDGPQVVLAATSKVTAVPALGLNGEPRDDVTFGQRVDIAAPAPEHLTQRTFRLRGAATRIAMMAGAIGAIEKLSVQYAYDRVQFGRPIAGFQAVQHRLVRIAEEALVARHAAALVTRALESGAAPNQIAAAKVLLGRAADEVSTHAHQVHGAIGVTREYGLHPLTRRLWTWRQEYGSAREWSAEIGRTVVSGADKLWPFVADGLVPQD